MELTGIESYYEVHGVSPPPELLVRIADALAVPIDELFGRLKRLEELPRDDQASVLKKIDALAERAGRRKAA